MRHPYESPIPIESYGPGFFRLNGAVHEGPLLLLPGYAGAWAGFDDVLLLLENASGFDVLLVGTGAIIAPLPKAARALLDGAGIGVDLMATPVACRSYNILLSEGRRVAAALIPV